MTKKGNTMNISRTVTRSAGALAAAAAVVSLATAQAASAAPAHAATTTNYTNTTYLQHALGLPASDTSPAIEPVTYDRFQWLLQQSGDFAVLIGDPAQDATFADRAQDVEAAAQAAGVKKVYWFDPNLSGSAKVGDITEPNLDIRNPAGITSLPAASQAVYGNAWLNLVGQYLGDGVTATQNDVNSESATVTATTGTATVNDDGLTAGHSTKVGDTSGGALYDYSSGAAPANVSHSFFLIYNKDGAQAKVVSWTDLTTQADATSTKADVTTAIGTVGASHLTEVDQFAWWKSEVNAKQVTQAPRDAQGASLPVLKDADNADGWRINQITYPELVDLLKHATTANAVILFGGTWCPNTRPVLPFVNRQAQKNGVEVFNFDTVLDGGVVGGGTTSSSNPLQSRNTAAFGATANANPSFLYGDLVSQYLTNVATQYDYTKGGPGVSYFPSGDSSGTLTTVRKLQVPFLIGYQGSAGTDPNGGVTRQWIVQNDDSTYTEYMSQWWYTNPQPNQLGITTIPLDAPIWSTINAQLASFTWQTDPSTLYPDTGVDTDDTQYLVAADTATVTYTAASGSTPAKVTVTSAGSSPIDISPAALSAALSAALTAVGTSAPANLAAAKSALIDAETAATPDTGLIANLSTITGAWGVAQQRKTKVINTWGKATSPGSVAGGLAAVHALEVFFGGFAETGSVTDPPPATTPVTTPTSTPTPVAAPAPVSSTAVASTKVSRTKASKVKGTVAKAPTSKKAGKYRVTITTPKGSSKASGKVTVKLKKGKTTKKVVGKLSHGVVTVSLPKLARGTWKVTISWPGDTHYLTTTVTAPSIKVIK
jgi:hypothetical protein